MEIICSSTGWVVSEAEALRQMFFQQGFKGHLGTRRKIIRRL